MNLWKRTLAVTLTVGLAAFLLTVSLHHPVGARTWKVLAASLSTAFFVVTPNLLFFRGFGRAIFHRRPPLNWLLSGIGILVCTIGGNLLLNVCSVAMGLLPADGFWNVFWTRVQFSATLAMIFGMGAIGYHGLRKDLESTTMELRNRQLEQERAAKIALEAQLASLESHIRPHFLFNTLNTISSLIPEDPGLAENLVGKLAALLRSSLDSNQERLASLEAELKIVGDYLEIERARYGDRLRFRSDVPPELRSAEVPALSLQTLVENSVKYAVGSRFEGAEIRIGASAHNGSLCVKVSDDGPGFSSEQFPPGHGLDSLQRRLTVLFGPAARLEVSNDSGATVCLTIPRPAA